VASRSGDRIEVVDLRRVTHFAAREKLTFAVTPDRDFVGLKDARRTALPVSRARVRTLEERLGL